MALARQENDYLSQGEIEQRISKWKGVLGAYINGKSSDNRAPTGRVFSQV